MDIIGFQILAVVFGNLLLLIVNFQSNCMQLIMLVIDKTAEVGYFGKHQRTVAITFFIIFQLGLYLPVALLIYGLLTLDWQILGVLLLITIIQFPITRSQTYIDILNKYIQPLKYFDHYETIFEEVIAEGQKCIFGVHPHSVYGLGLLTSMNLTKTGPFAKMVGLSSRFILNFPIAGAILKAWGIERVDHSNLKRLMRQGKNIGLIPGGFEEATITNKQQMRFWISNRKGFVKYALQHQYAIYPLIIMNEHQAFSTFNYFMKFRLFLNRLKLPGVFFWNKFTGPFLPPFISLHIIVGKGIKVSLKQGEQLSKEHIEEAHQNYMKQCRRIYEKYSKLNGNLPLKIY